MLYEVITNRPLKEICCGLQNDDKPFQQLLAEQVGPCAEVLIQEAGGRVSEYEAGKPYGFGSGTILATNGRFVITSYSIHYTKLYECRPQGSCPRAWSQGPGGARRPGWSPHRPWAGAIWDGSAGGRGLRRWSAGERNNFV